MIAAGPATLFIDPVGVWSGCSGLASETSAMLTAAGMLGLLTHDTAVSLDAIRRAPKLVAEERERLREEREAFSAFADRVERVPVATRADGCRSTGGSWMAGTRTRGGLQSVHDAYRQSVMAVDHYETDYDESLEEHMATELSPELAATVVNGSHVTPALRRSLAESARNAARDREVIIDNLDDECTDLEAAADRLCGIVNQFEVTQGDGLAERTFPDLQTRWRRLENLQTESEAVLDRRQHQLRQQSSVCLAHDRSPVAVSTYLFNDLDADFPVLATGTKLLERIETEKQHTVEALTERRR